MTNYRKTTGSTFTVSTKQVPSNLFSSGSTSTVAVATTSTSPSSLASIPLFSGFLSFFRGIFQRQPRLGTIWEGNHDAGAAYDNGSLRSVGGGAGPIRVAFRNASSLPLILCWIAENGTLHHFYKLEPISSSSSRATSAVGTEPAGRRVITDNDHVETTCVGHAFCIAYIEDEEELEQTCKRKSFPNDDPSKYIIGGYRPLSTTDDGTNHNDGNADQNPIQLVTVTQRRGVQGQYNPTSLDDVCCHGGSAIFAGGRQPLALFGLRGTMGRFKRRENEFADEIETNVGYAVEENDNHFIWSIDAQQGKVDPTPYDTTCKMYETKNICGWSVHLEDDWHDDNSELEEQFVKDLEYASKVLPKHARDYLKEHCSIWVNKSIKYGPRACPVRGKGACYHPDKDWLIENGLHPSKALCVEINDGPDYKNNLKYWKTGGLMIHELSHAYHHRMIPNGYKNKDIEDCYKQAMKDKLYECVKVHGSQGPTCKAYACNNCMEYFAELSTAFLGGLNEEEEYNKWYPFNRNQLKEHDPRAYELLSRLWQVESS